MKKTEYVCDRCGAKLWQNGKMSTLKIYWYSVFGAPLKIKLTNFWDGNFSGYNNSSVEYDLCH